MQMIWLKIASLIIVCGLYYAGGQFKGRIRDVGVPIVLGFTLALLIPANLFVRIGVGLLEVAAFNTIRLGYGNYEEGEKNSLLGNLTHDRNGWYIRLIWGLIVAVVAGFALWKWHFIGLWRYLGYIGLNGAINYGVSRLRFPVLLADICVASGIGSIVFML